MPSDILDFTPSPLSPEARRCWMAAVLSSPQADTFCCTPAWQLSFRSAFTKTEQCILRGTEDSFMAWELQELADGAKCFTPLEYMWFSGCPVMGPEGPEIFADSIPLLEDLSGSDPLRLIVSGVDSRRKLINRLSRACGRPFRGGRISTIEQRAASLEGGVDGFLSRRSSNFRSKLKKASRIAREAGIYFERPDISAENCGELFDRMLAVERRSWKGLEGSGIVDAQSAAFYRTMLGMLAPEHEARLIFARHEGTDIGFIFGGVAGPVYRGQQFSYDAAWSRNSIGDLLQIEQIRDLCEEGLERYDLGMCNDPRMAYKEHWAESVRHSETWIILPEA